LRRQLQPKNRWCRNMSPPLEIFKVICVWLETNGGRAVAK
jgi:hypothetical protein